MKRHDGSICTFWIQHCLDGMKLLEDTLGPIAWIGGRAGGIACEWCICAQLLATGQLQCQPGQFFKKLFAMMVRLLKPKAFLQLYRARLLHAAPPVLQD